MISNASTALGSPATKSRLLFSLSSSPSRLCVRGNAVRASGSRRIKVNAQNASQSTATHTHAVDTSIEVSQVVDSTLLRYIQWHIHCGVDRQVVVVLQPLVHYY